MRISGLLYSIAGPRVPSGTVKSDFGSVLRRFEEAGNIFDRMLWLNPSDNQGVRFLTDEVAAKVAWDDSENR